MLSQKACRCSINQGVYRSLQIYNKLNIIKVGLQRAMNTDEHDHQANKLSFGVVQGTPDQSEREWWTASAMDLLLGRLLTLVH